MGSLLIIRGPLRRSLPTRPSHVLKRCVFSARRVPSARRPVDLTPMEAVEFQPPHRAPARTRFAPSPTGYLHIGSLRTALFNYLYAKASGGQFILRIEDTDQSRLVPDAEKRLYEDLKWAGLDWDEGPDIGGPYNPYKQSENLPIYSQYADELMNRNRAYRCFCTPEELDQMKSNSIYLGNPSTYNGHCSHIPPDISAQKAADGHEHCIRFKRVRLANHNKGAIAGDIVYGDAINRPPDDDFIIIKKDGYPTYHFANVIDDHRMNISHVIRGAEWLTSTPRHIALYQAFGWAIPRFAHVGLLTNKEGQKLSKRHHDADVASWRDRGYLPITLLNYVLFLGWSTGKTMGAEGQVLGLDGMLKKFDLNFTKGNIIVNDKYEYFQRQHLQRLRDRDPNNFYETVEPYVLARIEDYEMRRTNPSEGNNISAELGDMVPRARDALPDYVREILEADTQHYKGPELFVQRIKYLIWNIPESAYAETYKERISNRLLHFVDPEILALDSPTPEVTSDNRFDVVTISEKLRACLYDIKEEQWTVDGIQEVLKPILNCVYSTVEVESTDGEMTSEIHPWGWNLLRWLLLGTKTGPGVSVSIALMSRTETLARIDNVIRIARKLAW
ncbi:uncharacterized protein GGS22DRAFT_31115 [Annulohypoxylon maeteangense]|uniref:uncharacterized protein n=1 Tax=Annulohypoxylon maeteangense TaxID=1927788 RepID=UPI0020071ED9|nr:uncharacterized protein GGS22DRAFT_31115 [Annulohypoxylon maeteangense]KAI0883461.1 hypothetical protein GGS22DRAFT_31115 [Annulohypoxylon maeteangense]